jgi:glucokinase
MTAMLLAGDIGGTNTRLVLIDPSDAARGIDVGLLDRRVDTHVYASNDHPSIEAVVAQFLARSGKRATAAAFGVAGPVIDGVARATNLDWIVDTRSLAAELGTDRVAVKNDLETTGIGLLHLPAASFRVLNEGRPDARGNAALIAAGTGLGKAILVREVDGTLRPIPSEGGHADFGPRDPEQDAIVAWLRGRVGQVSHERLVSGPAIHHLWEYGREAGDPEPESITLEIVAAGAGAPARIAKAALANASPRCSRALDRFVTFYGQSAQALALTALATGGMFVGGGIAPKILPALIDGRFMAAFRTHPHLEELLGAIPVKVALDDRASLLGAVALAARTLR